ncbi:MAG: neutral/alkaline non-lysosomal ceramidase N-terminal domain-containing protein [Thermonemataceae bacterium]
MKISPFVFFCTCFLILSQILQAQNKNSTLYAGATKVNITPKEPVYLSGYGGMYSKRITDEVHDSLFCRAVVLKMNEKKVVFISTDLIGSYFYEEVYEALQKNFNLKPEEVFLTAIHTHSAPVYTFLEKDKNTANYRYTQDVIKKIVSAVKSAAAQTYPVTLEIKEGFSPIGINRRALKFDPDMWPWDGGLIKMARNPEGEVNNSVLVLKLGNEAGDFNACMFEYGCHARSQSPASKVITGDFFGIAEQRVEEIQGKGMIAAGFAGASGDVDPIYVLNEIEEAPHWIPETELMGQLLAQEIVRTYRRTKEKITPLSLQSTFKTIYLPSRKEDEFITNDSLPKTPLNITVTSIGELAFVGIGCEVLVEIGNHIKAFSPYKHTFIMTHCNGGAGYLSPKSLYKERGYEVSSSPFGPEAAEAVIKETLQLLYQQKTYLESVEKKR